MNIKRLGLIFLGCASVAAGVGLPAEETAPRGRIEFSNGQSLEGALRLTQGKKLKLLAGDAVMDLDLNQVGEIHFTPESEDLVRKFRFPEAGKPFKEEWGDPYPTRSLIANVTLADGTTATGHLFTTVVYVEAADRAHKVILAAKQKGEPGQSLDDLVFSSSLKVFSAGRSAAGVSRVTLPENLSSNGISVVALTRPGLSRLVASTGKKPGEYAIPTSGDSSPFIAVRSSAGMVVGWPKTTDPLLQDLANRALSNIGEFYDDRRLLGLYAEADSDDVYTLLMLKRTGRTTDHAAVGQPWTLGVWRWKFERPAQRWLLAGRGFFFTGRIARNDPDPGITLSEKLWDVNQAPSGRNQME